MKAKGGGNKEKEVNIGDGEEGVNAKGGVNTEK